MAIIGILGLIVTMMVYFTIYFAMRSQNQIQVLQVQQIGQNCEIADFTSLFESAVGICYAYLVFLVCCLPYFISLVTFKHDN